MTVLVMNGALPGDGGLERVQAVLQRELEQAGARTRIMAMRDMMLAYCQGCFECWHTSPGLCKTKDGSQEVAAAFIGSDIVVFLTPISFGGYSSELKKGLDRIIGLVQPFFTRIEGEVHHVARYDRYPGLVGIGVLPEPRPEEERIFHELVARNALNMYAPWHSSRVLYRGDDGAALLAAIRPLFAHLGRAA